jgi:hypothetical protein
MKKNLFFETKRKKMKKILNKGVINFRGSNMTQTVDEMVKEHNQKVRRALKIKAAKFIREWTEENEKKKREDI